MAISEQMDKKETGKKKLLFICSNMSVGGFQKSLINLLLYLDYDRYDVTLYLVHKEGIFLDFVNPNVKIITEDRSDAYCEPYGTAIKKLLRKRYVGLAIVRTVNLLISLMDKGKGSIFMSRRMKPIGGRYDVCIDYGGQHQNYYMIDKIDANKKISYFHSDYSKWDYYRTADERYYKKDDWIVTVSDECVQSMKNYFPNVADRIVKIENIITEKTIDLIKSMENIDKNEELPHRKHILCTVGRVCSQKGADLAIEACEIVRKTLGADFLWIWVGPVERAMPYSQKLKEKKLEDNLLFVGARVNPYQYMDMADLVVHPSRFEGKAVAVEEALVMNKPVLATKYSTVGNQITDGITGVIVDMDARSLADGIVSLLKNPKKLKMIADNQTRMCRGNESEIEKFYRIVESGTAIGERENL